jgi:prepilin-type N-terminal cleavage/methylation domain-containing protein
MNYELKITNKKYSNKVNQGFTLVEVMIAVGLFVIVMVAGIGAVISANNSHKKSQAQRAILDSMSFILEDMSRNIRLGKSYRCPAGVSTPSAIPGTDNISAPINGVSAEDCALGNEAVSLAFESQNGSSTDDNDQVVYFFYDDDGDGSTSLYKSTNSGQDFFRISGPEVKFASAKSGFTVTGATVGTSGPGDTLQPRVTIHLIGEIFYKTISTPFDIQTTVSQRLIDS